MTGERTAEGFYGCKGGIEAAIARGLAYAPHADLVWFETGEPNFSEARAFAEALHAKYPGKACIFPEANIYVFCWIGSIFQGHAACQEPMRIASAH
eukprot:1144156-Pelagomonas_calceolata.AAC.3